MTTYSECICAGLSAMGIATGDDLVGRLTAHLEMVTEVNTRFNLTAIDPDNAVSLHILDSMGARCALGDAPPGRFADIGSGAGYPGVPLSLVTGRPVDLVESVGKKAAFLSEVTRELRLDATVHRIRAEELVSTHRDGFSAVTARALSALPSLVELAAPLLKPSGLLICLKGRPAAEEIASGNAVATLCGMGPAHIVEVSIPGIEAARCIVVYRKTGRSRLKLPRRTGLAQRSPLG